MNEDDERWERGEPQQWQGEEPDPEPAPSLWSRPRLVVALVLALFAIIMGVGSSLAIFQERQLVFSIPPFRPMMLLAIIPGAAAAVVATIEMFRSPHFGHPARLMLLGMVAVASPFVTAWAVGAAVMVLLMLPLLMILGA